LKEVFKYEGGVDVGFGEGYEVHVEVAGVEEGAVFDAFDWGLGGGFFGGNYLIVERDGDLSLVLLAFE
jgi:hypothetical protein